MPGPGLLQIRARTVRRIDSGILMKLAATCEVRESRVGRSRPVFGGDGI
jgi:hypothetical protein